VGWVCEGSSTRDLWLLCVFGCISVVVVGGFLCQGLQGLRLCKVGIVGWSAGGEYV
jgi:hypothetical protein